MEKKVKGKQYLLFYNIKAVGKNIKQGKGEGGGNFGKNNQDFSNMGWEEFIHSFLDSLHFT